MISNGHPVRFLLWSSAAQIVGFATGILTTFAAPSLVPLAHAGAALAVAGFMRLPAPWCIANLMLPLALALNAHSAVEISWIGGILFALAAIFVLPTFRSRVPYYPSAGAVPTALAATIRSRDLKAGHFLEIGCGFGGVITHLARDFPEMRFVGVELGPIQFLIAKLRTLTLKNVEIRLQDMWRVPLEKFDLVYAFLSPAPMPALWEKVTKEMRGGTVFISNSFQAPPPPSHTIPISQGPRAQTLLLYEIPSTSG